MVVTRTDVVRETAFEKWFRYKLSSGLLWLQNHRRLSADNDLPQDSWIIAPHPDDEVLGCGGAILRKRALGANIRIVFLTDGGASHPGVIPYDELCARRRAEATNACNALDVPSDHVFFLGLPDGALMQHVDECATKLAALFAPYETSQFFVPDRLEPPSDHKAAWYAVLGAIGKLRRPARLLGYAVWCWDRWPFVPIERRGDALRRLLRRFKDLMLATRWLVGCRVWIEISSLLDAKKIALEHHASQMHGISEAAEGSTLLAQKNGAFIEQLLRPYEIFSLTSIDAALTLKSHENE